MAAGQPAPQQTPPPTANGRLIAARLCDSCHGSTGRAERGEVPKLDGLEVNYLIGQLANFKSGSRPSEVMTAAVASLSREDLADVAESYSARPPFAPDRVESDESAKRGAMIVYGSGPLATPCDRCHGPTLNEGGIGPRLAGQHATYICAQLDSFAAGRRPNPIMTPVASAISHDDRCAVAEYLASLPP